MTKLENKIDFAVLVTVHKANPNGDPLSGNRPREDFNGHGEISDVCIKRKIRNRWQDMGENIFVQSDDRVNDGCKSLNERVKKNTELTAALRAKDKDAFTAAACQEYIDVRAFGQLFAYKEKSKKKNNKDEEESEKEDSGSVSIGVRGPVSICVGESVDPIDITTMQIVKSTNGTTTPDGTKSSDTFGSKSRVEFGLYVIRGAVNVQLAEKTGFSSEDADKLKQALCTMFDNDASAARPEGSIEVRRVYWWKHNSKSGDYSSAKVQRALRITRKASVDVASSFEDYDIQLDNLPGLTPEIN